MQNLIFELLSTKNNLHRRAAEALVKMNEISVADTAGRIKAENEVRELSYPIEKAIAEYKDAMNRDYDANCR